MGDFYRIEDGGLKEYTGREEVIRIPDGIHTIGEGALKGCVSLKRAVLPPGLRRIMGGAFKGCRKLEEVEIPEGVSYIGSYAFHRCHNLIRAVVPASVEELGECAFLYCDSLREVRIPGVKKLGTQAFANDMHLEKLQISRHLEEGCICDVFTGCGKVTEISFADGECWKMTNVVEAAAGEGEMPPLVRRIVRDILRMMELDGRCMVRYLVNIKHVEVPEGIESLARGCFFDMRGILTVSLPKSLKDIGERAFRNCISLEKVNFATDQVRIHEDAFKNCTSLKTIRTCQGTEYTFQGLTGATVEGGGAEEPAAGFSAISTALQGDRRQREGENDTAFLQVPEFVRTIQKQVLGNFRISGSMLLKYLGAESRVVIPEGIRMIAPEAFAGNEAIDKVIFPESLEEIGREAFRDCLLLQTAVFPKGLRRIGAGAFENCVKLLRVQLPWGIFRVEARVFRRCAALQEAEFPEGLTEVGESSFYGCTSLRKVHFPESFRSVGKLAFYLCGSLKEIRLCGLEHVGSLAFARSGLRKAWIRAEGRGWGTDVLGSCEKLKTLVLEEGTRHVPEKLAYGCSSLERVELPGTLESAGRNPWEGTPFLERWIRGLEIPDGGPASGLEGGILWDGRGLAGRVALPKQVRIVAGGAFYGNGNLTEVILPESVRWVGPAAFKGCKGLLRVQLPSGIRRLEGEVFAGCGALEEVVLAPGPETCAESRSLGPEASVEPQLPEQFREDLPAWLSIEERAFYQCRRLSRIRLDQAQWVGKEALAGCVRLEQTPVKAELLAGERAFEDTCLQKQGAEGLALVGALVVSGAACRGKISLPEGIRGIAPYAFAGNRQITEVALPRSLKWIGEGAFFGCGALEEMEFPPKLRRVGERAFEKCAALREVSLSAPQVGARAFYGCISLVRAELSRTTILGEGLFAGCRELKECVCGRARAVQPYCFSGCRSLRHFSFGGLCTVRPYAFLGCESLEEAEFQDGICLGEHALEDCSGLRKITLTGPRGDFRLGAWALGGCTGLSQVIWQGKVWEFCRYSDIFSEQIPEKVRLLFHSAMSCFEVEREEILRGYRGAAWAVKIPEGIRRIQPEVFRDAVMLGEVEIPESVSHIGARAFHGTAWMEARRRESSLVTVRDMLLDGSGCEGTVEIPAGIHLVCGWAFANGLKIERICFSSERVQVEEYAFRNCISLREIVLPEGSVVRFHGIEDREKELHPLAKQAVTDSLNCFKTDEDGVLKECTGNISCLKLAWGITAVGEGAFQDGNLLTEVTFPETVSSIGRRAFAGCKWLREVRGALGVEWVGEGAFFGCGTLERVEFGECLGRMGAGAFENCTSLEEILLPEGMEEIPARAFFRCHSLKKISLPSTLKRIGREAFAFCISLEKPLLPQGVSLEERAFYGASRALEEG